MGLLLSTITDPRDNLEKARLWELEKFAKDNGVDLPQGMPAQLIRRVLRARGLTQIAIPKRVFGKPDNDTPEPVSEKDVAKVSAEEDLLRQFMAQKEQPQPEPPASAKPKNAMAELRSECKRRGIKMTRKDTMASLKAKLNGENPA